MMKVFLKFQRYFSAQLNWFSAQFIFLLLLSSHAVSSPFLNQSLAEIEKAVMEFKRKENINSEKIKIEIGRLDPRLQLVKCSSPLEIFSQPSNSSQSIVGVRCNKPKAWSIFVPTKVTRYAQLVVTRRALPRGHLVGQNDIEITEKDVPNNSVSYIATKEKVIGKVLKKPLPTGTIIDVTDIEFPKIVRRGEQVTIFIEKDILGVRMQGDALKDGALGEKIRIKNTSSNRIIEATVIGPSTVEVQL